MINFRWTGNPAYPFAFASVKYELQKNMRQLILSPCARPLEKSFWPILLGLYM